MNKKIIIIIGILLSIAGISFAAVLDNYGSIVGTADIISPTFYIGSTEGETLLVNEKSSNCDSFGIDGTYRTFKTKYLGGVSFDYIPKISLQVRAKGTTASTSSVPMLGLAFGYYDGTGPQYLATTTFPLRNAVNNYPFPNMVASKKPSNVYSFFYEFTKICPLDDASCSVSIDKCDGNGFYTKIKLSK